MCVRICAYEYIYIYIPTLEYMSTRIAVYAIHILASEISNFDHLNIKE